MAATDYYAGAILDEMRREYGEYEACDSSAGVGPSISDLFERIKQDRAQLPKRSLASEMVEVMSQPFEPSQEYKPSLRADDERFIQATNSYMEKRNALEQKKVAKKKEQQDEMQGLESELHRLRTKMSRDTFRGKSRLRTNAVTFRVGSERRTEGKVNVWTVFVRPEDFISEKMIKRVEFVSLSPLGPIWEERTEMDLVAPRQRHQTTCKVTQAPFAMEYEGKTAFKVFVVVHLLDCEEPWVASHTLRSEGRGHDKIYNLDIPDHGGGETVALYESAWGEENIRTGIGIAVNIQRLPNEEAKLRSPDRMRWNGQPSKTSTSPVQLVCNVLEKLSHTS